MGWKNVAALLFLALLLSACLQLKPEPPDSAAHVQQNIEHLETALNQSDRDKLTQLLADELLLNYETISKDDVDRILALLVDSDTIDLAVLTELNRTTTDNTIVIDVELYLELIKNQEKHVDTKLLNIIMENLGNKWTGDKWLITGIISYTNEDYVYCNPATDPDELLDRFCTALTAKAYLDLNDLFAYTLVASDGQSVSYYRNNQQFIARLAADMQHISLESFTLNNRGFSLDSAGIQVTADLDVTLVIDTARQTKTVTASFTLNEIPNGLVISRLFYPSNFFGLL